MTDPKDSAGEAREVLTTNTELRGELLEAGDKLLQAAMNYYDAYRAAGCQGAVVWLTDTAGRMVILTRGEYRDTLLRNVHRLPNEADVPLIDYEAEGATP